MSRKLLNEELNRLTTEEYKDAEKLPIVVVLDNVRSLNNIGSVFRTSDAFRLSKIYLCGITATPPHREIHKTALGAEESVDWEYFEETTDAVQALKNEGYTILSVEQVENSISLEQFAIESEKKYAFRKSLIFQMPASRFPNSGQNIHSIYPSPPESYCGRSFTRYSINN